MLICFVSLPMASRMQIHCSTDWISISWYLDIIFFFVFCCFRIFHTCTRALSWILRGVSIGKQKLFSYYVNCWCCCCFFYCPNILKSSRAAVFTLLFVRIFFPLFPLGRSYQVAMNAHMVCLCVSSFRRSSFPPTLPLILSHLHLIRRKNDAEKKPKTRKQIMLCCANLLCIFQEDSQAMHLPIAEFAFFFVIKFLNMCNVRRYLILN